MNGIQSAATAPRLAIIAAGASAATASEAAAYMGPGAGGGSLPGFGAAGVVVALLLIALAVCALSALVAVLYAVGRRIAAVAGRRASRPSTGADERHPAASEVHA
jgi:hypothetical protein